MSRAGWIVGAISLAAFAAGCGRQDSPPGPALDPHRILQQEIEKGTMDFNRVVTVRLRREGKRLEVVSVNPTLVARAMVGGEEAKTLFRINDRGDALVLFSRDVPGSRSLKTEIPFSQLGEKQNFSFPVVQNDGRLKEESFAFEQIVQPPS